MKLTLAEQFGRNEGRPLFIDGKEVVMGIRFEITRGQTLNIQFPACKNDYRQGIEIAIDNNKGYVEIHEMKLSHPVLWTDTAPKNTSAKCFPKKEKGILTIWNVWQHGEYGSIEAWVGNAGIFLEQPDPHTYLLHCSNGIGDVDFTDLTVKVVVGD